MSKQEQETVADIIREKREMAAEIRAHLSNVPARREDQLLEADSLDREADRLEAAWKRERDHAIEHATRHAEAVARDNCRDCVHNPRGKNYEGGNGGNAAAMREALTKISESATYALKYRHVGLDYGDLQGFIEEMGGDARAALSAPPRNCDVGTPEEQAQRFGKLCGKYYNEEESCNEKCPLASLPIIHGFPRCQAYWAQTPYKAQEGGAK